MYRDGIALNKVIDETFPAKQVGRDSNCSQIEIRFTYTGIFYFSSENSVVSDRVYKGGIIG